MPPKRKGRTTYGQVFNDINEVHLEKARAVGLRKVPEKRDDIDTQRLVRIDDSDYLVIDNLRYSVPYLTKNAADELNRIAVAFHDSLTRKQFPVYQLVCSSILRTEEDVANLRKSGNPNASDNSAHCYGTTFDITYTRYWRDEETDEFMQPYELTKVLAEVLRDEKAAGRILVKYERKEHCLRGYRQDDGEPLFKAIQALGICLYRKHPQRCRCRCNDYLHHEYR